MRENFPKTLTEPTEENGIEQGEIGRSMLRIKLAGAARKHLQEWWTGKTTFDISQKKPDDPRQEWVRGRLTQKH